MSTVLTYLIPVVLTVVVGVLLREVFRNLEPAGVRDYRPCKGDWWEAKLNRCETGLASIPQQPVNTYTNLAYLAGGAYVGLEIGTPAAHVHFLACAYLCVGSALYHATSTVWAGSLDVSSMYAVFGQLAAFAVCRWLDVPMEWTAAIMLVVAVAAGYFLRYRFRGNMQLKIGIGLGITLVAVLAGMIVKGTTAPLAGWLVSLILFAVAFLAWNLDKAGKFPWPRWGHGVWHLLTAGAISGLFWAAWLLG